MVLRQCLACNTTVSIKENEFKNRWIYSCSSSGVVDYISALIFVMVTSILVVFVSGSQLKLGVISEVDWFGRLADLIRVKEVSVVFSVQSKLLFGMFSPRDCFKTFCHCYVNII